MNIHPIAQQVLDDRKAASGQSQSYRYDASRDATNQDKLFTVLALYLDHVVQELQDGELKAHILNLPEIQRVTGTLEVTSGELSHALAAITAVLLDSKVEFPDTQKVIGSVEVSNFPAFPKVTIPEHPRQIKADVTSLPKYVAEKLDAISQAVKGMPAPVVNVPVQLPPVVNLDLSDLLEQMQVVEQVLVGMAAQEAEQEPPDLSAVLAGLESVRNAIATLKFPVPNFRSSWEHSRQMQALDADTYYTYNAYGEVDTISVTLGDGIFTQTLTNTTVNTPSALDGVATHRVVTAKSRWIKTG